MPDAPAVPLLPALEVRRAAKSFGDTAALQDASFSVATGEILALLGPSGCGKTTTLRLLAGFERPDAGEICINGVLTVGQSVWRPPEQRRIGMVAQDFALFPHLTVAENVGFGLPGGHRAWWSRWRRRLRRTGDGDTESAQRIGEMLALVGLAGFAERFPHELSGGEAQRVALARALAPAPAAVLLDEPFSNLDQNLRASLRETMRAILKAADTAAVFVTHDREEALSLADRIAVMRAGRIEQIGAPDDIYYRPQTRFIGAFVGDANVLRGVKTPGRARMAETELGAVPLTRSADGGRLAAGTELDLLLRPEQLVLREADEAAARGAGGRRATVLSSQYYGHDQVVRVALASGVELEARLRTETVWRPGDAVDVVILDSAVAFPR